MLAGLSSVSYCTSAAQDSCTTSLTTYPLFHLAATLVHELAVTPLTESPALGDTFAVGEAAFLAQAVALAAADAFNVVASKYTTDLAGTWLPPVDAAGRAAPHLALAGGLVGAALCMFPAALPSLAKDYATAFARAERPDRRAAAAEAVAPRGASDPESFWFGQAFWLVCGAGLAAGLLLDANPVVWLFQYLAEPPLGGGGAGLSRGALTAAAFATGASALAAAPWLAAAARLPRPVARKLFHPLAALLVAHPLVAAGDAPLARLSAGVAAALLLVGECARYGHVAPLHAPLARYTAPFVAPAAAGNLRLNRSMELAPLYLVLGIAGPLWLAALVGGAAGPKEALLLSLSGAAAVGCGDAAAAAAGVAFGRLRWPGAGGRTAEGSVFMFLGTAGSLLGAVALFGGGGAGDLPWGGARADGLPWGDVLLSVAAATLLEAFLSLSDNLLLGVFLFAHLVVDVL